MRPMIGGRVHDKTITAMEKGGATTTQIDYIRETQCSTDANDVARHRHFINQYNPRDPYRELNNFIMHPDNYKFGTGASSPESIASILVQHGQPLYFNGPAFSYPAQLNPHIIFRPQQTWSLCNTRGF